MKVDKTIKFLENLLGEEFKLEIDKSDKYLTVISSKNYHIYPILDKNDKVEWYDGDLEFLDYRFDTFEEWFDWMVEHYG